MGVSDVRGESDRRRGLRGRRGERRSGGGNRNGVRVPAEVASSRQCFPVSGSVQREAPPPSSPQTAEGTEDFPSRPS